MTRTIRLASYPKSGNTWFRMLRDIAPSFANHSHAGVDAAIAFMNDANAGFGTASAEQANQLRQRLLGWSGHVASWLDQSDIPVHLVRYEDLQADTAGVLKRAPAFAGWPTNDEKIARIEAAHAPMMARLGYEPVSSPSLAPAG